MPCGGTRVPNKHQTLKPLPEPKPQNPSAQTRTFATIYRSLMHAPLQVEEKNVDTHTIATVSSVDARLAALRIAILGVGGRVEVVDVKQGVCVVKYKVGGGHQRARISHSGGSPNPNQAR